MKCPEVVEWMHRYVDHDLNEEESDLLFEHLRHCEDCAEKFELLNELSTQLEELPLVVPSFSLVDAILPRLEAIDRTHQEEGTTAEFISPVATVALESASNHRVQRKETSRRGRFYRVGALGTVAAAAILGLFIYQYEPQTIPNAEIKSESQDSSSTNAKMDRSNSAAESSVSDGEAADEANMDKMASQDTAATAPGSDKGLADRNNASGGSANQAPAATESPATGDKMPSANSSGKSTPAKSTAPASGADSNATKAGSSKQSEPSALQGSLAEEALNPYDLMETSVGDHDEMVSRMGIAGSGFAANATLNQWNSPNGSYTAELQDGHLYFYKTTSEVERLLVIDQSIKGNWVSGEWSGDSATFSYQTEQNGVTDTYMVDPLKESNIQVTSP